MISKVTLFFLSCVCFLQVNLAAANTLQEDILPWDGWVLNGVTSTNGSNKQYQLDSIFSYIRDSIFGLMGLIAIGVFLYIGFKLISARWNPEEFKKALNTFIYAVIGIFIVSFAFAAVRLIAGIDI